MDQARFSVCQFFEDGSQEYIQQSVDVERAVEAFSNCVVAVSTTRVVVTNGQVSLEWTYGQGMRKAEIAV
jgi:hypothetical protein